MSRVTLEIPEESLIALKISEQELGAALRMAAAVKLYELGLLSSGAAAQLAGLPRTVFLSRSADYGANTFRLTEVDLREEARVGDVPLLGAVLPPNRIDLRAHGIGETQAANLRARLTTFASDWDAAEMDAYDDYDTARVKLQAG